MAIESSMLPLGTKAPDFYLPDTLSGKEYSLADLKSDRATVIMFICNHCPYVIHVNEEIVKMANEYQKRGVSFIAISSNDVVNYPEDSPEKMKEYGERLGYPFPYLYDRWQKVAKAYDAACTPDFYVFNGDLNLVYRGRLCPSRPSRPSRPIEPIPVTGEDLRAAIDAVLVKRPVNSVQYPSMGCGIKWKQ